MHNIYSWQINLSKWVTLCDLDCSDDDEAIARVKNLCKLGFLQDFKQKYDFRLISPKNEVIFTVNQT